MHDFLVLTGMSMLIVLAAWGAFWLAFGPHER